jgi:hypothetical protein
MTASCLRISCERGCSGGVCSEGCMGVALLQHIHRDRLLLLC